MRTQENEFSINVVSMIHQSGLNISKIVIKGLYAELHCNFTDCHEVLAAAGNKFGHSLESLGFQTRYFTSIIKFRAGEKRHDHNII